MNNLHHKTIYFLALFLIENISWAGTGLKEAYLSALNQNEAIKIGQSKTKQTEESVNQNVGTFLPKLNLVGSYTRLGLPEVSHNPTYERKNYSLKFNATQSLFKGFKDFYIYRSSKEDVLSQKEQESFTRLNLYSSVTQYFYTILSYESDLKNLNEQRELLSSRVKELGERVKIGKSRKADFLSAKSQLASTMAQIELGKSQLLIAREGFANLTSLDANVSLESPSQTLPEAGSLSKYLERIENRPDILSLKRQLESTSKLAVAAKLSHLPSLDLSSNYYLDRSGQTRPSMWDVGLTFTLPLFEGGVVSSQVRQALEKQIEKSLVLDQTRKSAEKEIKTFHASLLSSQSQIVALEESIKTSEEAYKEHLKDYRYGLSTMLDVLQAQNSYLDAKKNYDRLRSQIFLTWAQLLISTADESIN